MSPMKSWAQDVTVGDGTNSSYTYPYGTSTNTSTCIMIYQKQEIRGGLINAIAFDCSTNSPFTTTTVKIYMADTDLSDLPYDFESIQDNFTLVYSGSPTLGTAVGWDKLNLDTKFTHDASKNLIVAVCRSSSSSSTNINYKFHSSDVSSLWYYSADIDPIGSRLSGQPQRPNTRFSFDLCTTHQTTTHHDRVEADCVTNGNVEYWQCDVCYVCFSDENCTNMLDDIAIPALGHNLDANGKCTRCDYTEPTMTEGDNTIQIDAVTGDKSEASGYQLYRYVPAKSGKLTVKSSTSGSGDTFGSLWNSDLSTRLTYDDDSAGGRQFLFTYDVTAQTVYYIGVRNYGGGALSGDYVINVDLDAPCDIDHHTMTPHEANNPTCSQKGNYAYYECSVCGRLYSDNRGENLLSGIPYIPALGHVLDEDKLCSRCGKTITQLEGTELDISSKDMPIHIYSTYVEYDDYTRIDNTGNLILTGTPGAGTYFYIYGNPANGQIVLRDLDFTRNGPLFYIANSPEIANIYVEGDVTLNSTSGGVFDQYCSTPKVSITGPGNLTMTANGNSHVLSGSTSLDIDIIGDLVMSGQMSSYSSSLLNAKANTITISQLTSEPFMNMSNTTLQAKGDIVVDCNGTSGYDYTGDNQVYLFQGLSSTEGTVRFRAAIGTDMEYCAVKVGDPVPSPSSSAPFAAYTKKIVHTNGFATYYNTLPSGTGTLTYNGNRPYLTLTKDLAGNTVFDMDVFKSAPIEIYDGYLTNAELRSCWDGHPVFTGTATEARFLRFNETLSAANTPILRELTLNVSS